MPYIDVILPLRLRDRYTYTVPEEFANEIEIGKRVIVQFGNRKIYTALIYSIHNNKPKDYETKDIFSVLDDKPIVNKTQIKLWEWIAKYYICSLGEVFKAALPSGLKLESKSKIIFNPNFDDYSLLTEKENSIFRFVEDKKTTTIEDVNKFTKQKNSYNILKRLYEKNALTIDERLNDNYKPKFETYIKVSELITSEDELNRTLNKLKKAPKQYEVLLKLIELSGIYTDNLEDISKSELVKKSNISGSIVNALIKKGILENYELEISRLKNINTQTVSSFNLSENQQNAYNQINDTFTEKDVVLLHGVTSSGKTEIYVKLIEDAISQGKQVLYLLPEIALTTQIIERLRRVFGDKIGVYHSKFNDSERVEIWNKILNKDYQIILGVRSSIFLPYSNLGLIIVDEEHEATYKQQNPAPRYNARDTSIVLSKFYNAKVLLGTATPAVETYFNVLTEKYGLVELFQRYQDIKLPEIVIVDTKKAYKKKQMISLLSPTLYDEIKYSLDNNEQVILFQNRRGYSPYLQCKSCAWIPKCEYCDVSLTYHKFSNNLVCHYCGYTSSLKNRCDECKSTEIQTIGMGTEKIEDEISIIFPDAIIQRMDFDSTRKKDAYAKIITKFENKEVDILIGTQMVSKGLDFDNVSLVGILNADNLLNFPDFRAHERSYQLMTQVSGRAGRKNKQGKVIIQTSTPDHYILDLVKNNNSKKLYELQFNERKQFRYPPFFKILTITLKHKNRLTLNKNSLDLAIALRNVFGVRVLGPEPPAVSKISNFHINIILIKIEKESSFEKAKRIINEKIAYLSSNTNLSSVMINFDVDPL